LLRRRNPAIGNLFLSPANCKRLYQDEENNSDKVDDLLIEKKEE
jgi:hypothetical protein